MPGRAASSSRRTRATWKRSRSRDPVVDDAALEVGAGQAEPVEVLERQVDPAAVEVLADVADEVRELERDAEVLRARPYAASDPAARAPAPSAGR